MCHEVISFAVGMAIGKNKLSIVYKIKENESRKKLENLRQAGALTLGKKQTPEQLKSNSPGQYFARENSIKIGVAN